MYSDFYPGIVVAWQLDGVKFALGPTIATTRTRLAGFGGYEKIENQPADDLLVGRLIAEQGYEVRLLPYTIQTVADFHSFSDLFLKALAVDCRHAPHAAVGTLRAGIHLWITVDVTGRGTRSVAHGGRSVYCCLPGLAFRHDVADCLMGHEATRCLEGASVYPGVGRHGLRHLAGELHP